MALMNGHIYTIAGGVKHFYGPGLSYVYFWMECRHGQGIDRQSDWAYLNKQTTTLLSMHF